MKENDVNVLAHKVYDAYCEAVGGKAFNGDDLPNSEEFFADPLKKKQSDAWLIATRPVFDLLLEVSLALGHPAYGNLASTTDAIDELRENALDYLEIPKN